MCDERSRSRGIAGPLEKRRGPDSGRCKVGLPFVPSRSRNQQTIQLEGTRRSSLSSGHCYSLLARTVLFVLRSTHDGVSSHLLQTSEVLVSMLCVE